MKLVFIIFVIAAVASGPFLAIWAMNTLFSVGIEYTISTWFAALILMIIANGASRATHRRDK